LTIGGPIVNLKPYIGFLETAGPLSVWCLQRRRGIRQTLLYVYIYHVIMLPRAYPPGKGCFVMLMLSLREDVASAIYAGTKRCELRKNRASVRPGETVAIYETRPRAAITGGFFVDEALHASVESLWDWMGDSGVSRERFERYFGSRDHGFAIRIRDAHRIYPEISLEHATAQDRSFRAPQSFLYLRSGSRLAKSIECRLHQSESI